MKCDSLGNAVTLYAPCSLDAVNDFFEGLITCEARVVNILQVAQIDASPLVQACCAALHLFAESGQAQANAAPFITRAQAALTDQAVSPRERGFVAAVSAWAAGDLARAMELHEQQAQEFPRDLASIKLGQYHLFNAGNSPGMLRLALHGLSASADLPQIHGMAAFAWEQCHLLQPAEAAARRAIAMLHREPWAHHALAHVLLTQGRLQEGLDFMQSASPTWTGLNSFMLTHNWWHLALFALEFGQTQEVLALYDQRVWGWLETTRRTRSVLSRCWPDWSWPGSMWARAGKMSPSTYWSDSMTMYCPFWICNTSTAWRGRRGPRRRFYCTTSRPTPCGPRPARCGNRSRCRSGWG